MLSFSYLFYKFRLDCLYQLLIYQKLILLMHAINRFTHLANLLKISLKSFKKKDLFYKKFSY